MVFVMILFSHEAAMQTQKQVARTGLKFAMLGAAALVLAGCVVDPYPYPPPAPVAAAPAYYPGPYSYYDYPPYYGPAYYGVYGPPVGVSVGFGERGGWRGGHWR